MRRTERIAVSLRREELAYLGRIAEAWGVPVATVAWAAIEDQLARWARRSPEVGMKIGAAAALCLLRESPGLGDRSIRSSDAEASESGAGELVDEWHGRV